VPNRAVDMNSRARSACYPRSTFYPLSDGLSTQNHQIIKPAFPLCSACRPHSQAPLCPYTQCPITDRAEGTFGRLRYFLGGDRPSQTAHLPLSRALFQGSGLELSTKQGWYFTVGSIPANAGTSKPPTYATHVQQKSNSKLQ
jgi:hypothetical protein